MNSNVATVTDMLRNSISSCSESRTLAAKKAIELEISEPFLIPICLQIFTSTHDQQLQFLSVCFVKNIVARVWTKQINESKEITKNILVKFLSEKTVLYLREIIIIVRRIVRTDLPHNWPDLVCWLYANFSLPHYPFVLKQIVKELDSKKIGRTEIREFLSGLFRHVISAWNSPNYVPVEELDSAVLILARNVGNACLSELSVVASNSINRWQLLLSKSDEKYLRKFLKHFSNFFESQPELFRAQMSTVRDLAIASLNVPVDMRQYVVQILHEGFGDPNFVTNDSIPFVMERIFRSGICLDDEDVEEWFAHPLESPGGPLDGSELREKCFDFTRLIVKKNGDNLFQNFPSGTDLPLLDAWLDCQIHLYSDVANSAKKTLTQFPHISSSQSNIREILVTFRFIKLLEMYIRTDMTQSELVDILNLLKPRLVAGTTLPIRVASVFAMKNVFDRFSDHPVWTHQSSLAADIVSTLSDSTDSEIVQWRLVNFLSRIVDHCEVLLEPIHQLSYLFFKSKSEMVRTSLIELFVSLVKKHKEELFNLCLSIVDDSLGNHHRSVPGHRGHISNFVSTDQTIEAGLRLLIVLIETGVNESKKSLLIPYASVVLRLWERQLSHDNCLLPVLECVIAFNCCGSFTADELRVNMQLIACERTLSLADKVTDATVDSCLELVSIISVVILHRVPPNVLNSIVQRLSSAEQEDGESMARFVTVMVTHLREETLGLLGQSCVSCTVLMKNLSNCFECMFGLTERIMLVNFMCDVLVLAKARAEPVGNEVVIRAWHVMRKQKMAQESFKKPRTQELSATERVKRELWCQYTDYTQVWSDLENRVMELTNS